MAAGARRPGLRRPLRRPADLFPRHQLLVGPGAHHAPGLYPQELRRDLHRLLGHAGEYAADRFPDQPDDDAHRLRLRLCDPLPRRSLGQCAALPDADHALRRLPRKNLRLEEHPRARGHPEPRAGQSRPRRRAARRLHLQRQRHRHHAHLLPAPLRRAADLQQHAGDPRRDAGSLARPRRRAVADAAQRRAAAMRERHRRRLHVHVPDLGRRLRDAALRRRRRGDDGPVHRDAVLARLQLADGQRHGFYASWRCRSSPCSPSAACSGNG